MDIKKWHINKSEYLLTTPWLVVRKDAVTLPTGAEMDDYYVLEYPEWVTVIAITEEGKFVMERQYRHGIQETFYEICGGTVEKGEDPLLAAKRELLEETGFGEGEWSYFMTTSPNPSAMTNTCHTYIAKGVKQVSEQNLEKTEDIDIHLLSKNELLNVMMNGGINQGDMLAPLWRLLYEEK